MRSMAQELANARQIRGGDAARPGQAHNEAGDTLDLRRRGRRRAMPDTLARAADVLPTDEAALLRSIYHDGVTIAAIATMAGINPATVRSRLRRLITRVEDPCFAFVLTHRAAWPPPMARVATACFLHGHPLRRAAADLNMSIAAVRRYRDAAAALCEAHRQTRTVARASSPCLPSLPASSSSPFRPPLPLGEAG